MALTNLPYDDEAILTATESATVLAKEVRDVQVEVDGVRAEPGVEDGDVEGVSGRETHGAAGQGV